MIDPEAIRLFSIVNADGSEVVLSNLGAGIVSMGAPFASSLPSCG